MPDPFESPRRKIARAKEHFADLQRKIFEFTRVKPYTKVIEPDPDQPNHEVHKVKLTESLPPSIGDVTADMAQNLRNALDNASYAVAVASGCVSPKHAAFPFARKVAEMANSLGRSKDVPPQIQSLFCGFQPYKGGDNLLWALNEICVADKHKMVVPIGTGVVTRSVSIQSTGGYFSMPEHHSWDRAKNEMELFTISPEGKFDYDFQFNVFVAFNDIEIVDGKPVLSILDAICGKVESILLGIEAESQRLGFIK